MLQVKKNCFISQRFVLGFSGNIFKLDKNRKRVFYFTFGEIQYYECDSRISSQCTSDAAKFLALGGDFKEMSP